MFDILTRYPATSVLVSDDDIVSAQRWLWDKCRTIAEPGGATALAALQSGRWRVPTGARVGVVVCGGNVSPGTLEAGA